MPESPVFWYASRALGVSAYVALTLFVLTVLVNAAARLLIWRVGSRAPAGGKGA